MRTLFMAMALVVLGGCVTQSAVDARAAKLDAEWQAANGNQPVPADVHQKDLDTAKAQLKSEEEQALLSGGANAAQNAATGNWIGAIFSAITGIATAVGIATKGAKA